MQGRMVWIWALSRIDSIGGAEEDRTPDLLCARQVLSQLSYGPASKDGHGGSGWT